MQYTNRYDYTAYHYVFYTNNKTFWNVFDPEKLLRMTYSYTYLQQNVVDFNRQ